MDSKGTTSYTTQLSERYSRVVLPPNEMVTFPISGFSRRVEVKLALRQSLEDLLCDTKVSLASDSGVARPAK